MELSVAVTESVNHLGISLFRALSHKNKGNVFISPFSLATNLAMLHSGARGETRQEMRKVLGYDQAGIQDEKVAEAFSGLLSSLDQSNDSNVLLCANSLVARRDFVVRDEYKELLTESFRASLFLSDFDNEPEKALADINKWVAEKTNGMITQILDSPESLVAMVLLNAIYFKGTWQNIFDERETRLRDFYNGGSKSKAKKVEMMHQEDYFGYSERETFAVLQMPYIGRKIAMIVLLPHSLDGIGQLVDQISPGLFKELHADIKNTEIQVSIPKFRFEYEKTMEGTLKDLGLNKVFDGSEADLSGMSLGKPLYLFHVVHKAVVEVNEKGTEAAAATALCIADCAVRKINFIVDHPFLFAIYSLENYALLFLGKVEKL